MKPNSELKLRRRKTESKNTKLSVLDSSKESINDVSRKSCEFTGLRKSEKINERKRFGESKLDEEIIVSKVVKGVKEKSEKTSELRKNKGIKRYFESEKTKNAFGETKQCNELIKTDDEEVVEKKSEKTTEIRKDKGIKRYFESVEKKSNSKESVKPLIDSFSSVDDDIKPIERATKKSKKECNSTVIKAKKDLKLDNLSSNDKAQVQKRNDKQIHTTSKKKASSNPQSSQFSKQFEKTGPSTRLKRKLLLFGSSSSSSESFKENDKFKSQRLEKVPEKNKYEGKTNSAEGSKWLNKKNEPKAPIRPLKKLTPSKSDKQSKFSKLTNGSKNTPRRKQSKPEKFEEIAKTPPRSKNSEIMKHLALIDEVGEKLKMNMEKDKKFKELEKKLDSIVVTSSPTITKTREKLAELNNFFIESTLSNLPPGLSVVRSENFHRYFHDDSDLNDKHLEKCLNNRDFNDTSEIFLDKLFKIVSSLKDDVSLDVNPYLERLAKINLKWQPKMHHVVAALINFGVIIENCPLKELFLNQKLRLEKLGPREANIFDESSNEEERRKILGATNLIMMFEVLHLCLTRGCTYDTSTLCNFVIIICWIRMEKNYLEHPMVVKLQECCGLALDHIPQEIWGEKKQFLSSKLSEMDPKRHHHNLSFLSQFLPVTCRAIELRQLTSFKMLKLLCNSKASIADEQFDYSILYNFLKRNPVIVNGGNYYESRSKIHLISYCLNLESDWLKETEDSLSYLKKISDLLRHFSMRIIDSMRQPDSTEVKNLLIRIRCKVVLYSHGRDVKEASAACIMDNSQPSPTRVRKREYKLRNLFPIEVE